MNLRTSLAALAVGATLLTGVTACSDDTEPTASDPTPTATDPEPTEPDGAEPSETDSAEPTPTETTEPAPGTVAAPVYFTGDTPFGNRLYREFREVESDNPMEEAAALLLAGDALDPDYGTLLNGVTIDAVAEGEGLIVVTLGEDSITSAPKGYSLDDATVAVQSLVYTLQGTAQTRDPVKVTLADGSPADLFGLPTGAGLKAAEQLDVLSLVNITTPAEGATASGTLAVEGVASSFEATVPFVVTDAEGTEVLNGFSTAEGFIDKLYPWSAEIDVSGLEPGSYVLRARTDDPSGGEGPGPFEDTKTFTVE